MADIGSVRVKVIPDASEFREQLRGLIEAVDDGVTITETTTFDYNDAGLVAQQVKVTTLSRAAVVDAAINRRIALERQAQRIRSRLERES